MSFSAIQPIVLQPHPAFNTQVQVLQGEYGARVRPVTPASSVEHERWRAPSLWSRIAQAGAVHIASDRRQTVGYVAGSLFPKMHGLLTKYPFLYLDIDDPLSLFGHGMRNNIPLPLYGKLAARLASLKDKIRLSFWTQTQLGNFLANLPADATFELLETGVVSVLPPAIQPQVESSMVGRGEVLRCLCISSGKFWYKGLPDVLVAVAMLAERGLPIALTIVADGVPDEWQRFIASKSCFTLISRVTRPALNELFRDHDVLLFTSHHDTFGWVMLEAKSFGMPTVATDFYNRPEVINHGNDGLLVRDPFDNPFHPVHAQPYCASHFRLTSSNKPQVSAWIEPYINEVADTLARLISDRKLLRSLGDSALASVQPDGAFGSSRRIARLRPCLPL